MLTDRQHDGLSIGVIGAGVVGTALAVRLQQAGYRVVAAASRTYASAQRLAQQAPGCQAFKREQEVVTRADLVFLTVPDDVIQDVADSLEWRRGQMVVHCSGAKPLSALRRPRQMAAQVGAFHPLQTFSTVQAALEDLPGSTIAVEADGPLLCILKDIAIDLGARAVELAAEGRVLYHASAVMASNYLVTLLGLAASLWEEVGLTREDGLEALLPLVRGTLHNIEASGVPMALTGPIARGDVGTVESHIDELERKRPELLGLYRELALQTIPIAEEKGCIGPETAQGLRDVFRARITQE